MDDLRPALRPSARRLTDRLTATSREALLIRNWMSHDARWFMAVAREYGLAAANRALQDLTWDRVEGTAVLMIE